MAVLERAGFVTKRKRGRERRVVTNMTAIERVRTLLDHFERLRVERLERFEAVLAEDAGSPEA